MNIINEKLGLAEENFNDIGCEYFISNGYRDFKSIETAVFMYKPDIDVIVFNSCNENYSTYKQIIESYMQLKESKRKEVIGLAGDDDIMHALNMIDGIMLRRSYLEKENQ